MLSANLAGAISTVAQILAIVPGLWLAGQFLPWIVDVLPSWAAELVRSRGSIRFAFWLILGSLFTAPLLDLISVLSSLTEIFSTANWSSQQRFTAGFGSAPFPLYLILNDLATLAVYGFVAWAGWKFLEEQRARGAEPFEMTTIETAFVLTMGGAISNRAVLWTMLAWMELPFSITTTRYDFGTLGFIASWISGLVLLAVILILLYRSLPDTGSIPPQSIDAESHT